MAANSSNERRIDRCRVAIEFGTGSAVENDGSILYIIAVQNEAIHK